ncbi:hypothetical protein GQ44DRAFT_625765 [Phaeosphaeriaceae sp. PMI808]|nr:hypothetical protein GQ44DRAFT_625765 [Phaeosphaeriaceae sp. PMI808]
MSAKHNLHTAASIPADIAPSAIIAALHDHNTALSLQALTQGHHKLPATDQETLKDTYWYPTDLHAVSSYLVTEVITFLPGVGEWGKKYLKFPSCFQDTPTGIKTRADASGVIVRAEFRVVQGGAAAEVEGEGAGIGDAEWVLVEDVEVSCAWWMMPFVKGKMEQAHRGICAKVVEKVAMEQRQRAVAGDQPELRLNKNKDLPGVPLRQEQPQHQYKEPLGVFEVDALDTQRSEVPAPLPEKITYR